MKVSYAIVLMVSLVGAAAVGQEASHWGACAARDAKAGKIKEGELKIPMESVRRIQQALVTRGHVIAEIDGTLNKDTKAGLKKFQGMQRFDESGEIDLRTLNALGFGVAVLIATDVKGTEFASSEMARSTGEAAPLRAGLPIDVNVNGTGDHESLGYLVLGKDQLKAMQKRLKAENLYGGETDGGLTAEFIVAVRSFQAAKALKTKSLIDLPTLVLIPEVKVDVEVTGKLDVVAPGK